MDDTLHIAAGKGRLQEVEALLRDQTAESKAKLLDQKDDQKWRALHHAAFEGHAKVVDYLIKAGANICAEYPACDDDEDDDDLIFNHMYSVKLFSTMMTWTSAAQRPYISQLSPTTPLLWSYLSMLARKLIAYHRWTCLMHLILYF